MRPPGGKAPSSKRLPLVDVPGGMHGVVGGQLCHLAGRYGKVGAEVPYRLVGHCQVVDRGEVG
jgi:hypothetical protein